MGDVPGAPLHLKAAYFLNRSVSSVKSSVDWGKVRTAVEENPVVRSAGSALEAASKKTAEAATWARSYAYEVPDVTVSMQSGSNVIYTSADLTTKLKRGDKIKVANDIFTISSDEKDRFTANEIHVKDEYNRKPGIRRGGTINGEKIYVVGDRARDAYSAVGNAGSYVAGVAAAAAAKTETARLAEEDVADILLWRQNTSTVQVKALPSKQTESNAEQKDTDLTKVLSRGEKIKVNGVAYTISTDPKTPFTSSVIPLATVAGDQPAVNQEADIRGGKVTKLKDRWAGTFAAASSVAGGVGSMVYGSSKTAVGELDLFAAGSNRVFVSEDLRSKLKPGDKVTIGGKESEIVEVGRDFFVVDKKWEGASLSRQSKDMPVKVKFFEKGSNTVYVTGSLQRRVKRGDQLQIGGETYAISADEKDPFNDSVITVTKPRTVSTLSLDDYTIADCWLTLEEGSSYAKTTSSLVGKISRGSTVIIGGDEYTVSTSIFRRFTGTQLPLDQPCRKPVLNVQIKVKRSPADQLLIQVPSAQDPKIYLHGGAARRNSEPAPTTSGGTTKGAVFSKAQDIGVAAEHSARAAGGKAWEMGGAAASRMKPYLGGAKK